MNFKENDILKKLLKIATNQQKILERLAQANPEEAYLRSAAQIAAANTGFAATNVNVVHNEGYKMPNMVHVDEAYTVFVKGAPKNNEIRQKFINTLKTQVNMQKPELGKNLSIILED